MGDAGDALLSLFLNTLVKDKLREFSQSVWLGLKLQVYSNNLVSLNHWFLSYLPMIPKEISAFYFAYSGISLDPYFTQLTKYMESLSFSLTATLHLEFLFKWAHIIIISLVQLYCLPPLSLLISIAHTIYRFLFMKIWNPNSFFGLWHMSSEYNRTKDSLKRALFFSIWLTNYWNNGY